MRETARAALVVALVFAAAVATSPVMVSVELLRVGPWLASTVAGAGSSLWSGEDADDPLAGIDLDRVFLCAGNGCGCTPTMSSTRGCCCYPALQQRIKRARALAEAGKLEFIQGDDEDEAVEREVPLDGPGWRSLSCRGLEGLLLGVDVRHWQPSGGGPWYAVLWMEGHAVSGALVRVSNDALAVDAPPPERV
ncbi:MAG: hypothetical protein AAF797_04295 [Planctomycetota bacterium]